MGNLLPITYGGHLLSLLFPPSTKLPHSVLGHYLASTNPNIELDIQREEIRKSAKFETEVVTFRQEGKRKAVFIVDRQEKEESPMLYSIRPWMKYTRPEECSEDQYTESPLLEMYQQVFGAMFKYFDTRTPPESYYATNMFGLLKDKPTNQDHLEMTQKRGAIYYKCKEKIIDRHAHYAAIAYILDSALAFMPATFAHQFMDDYSILSTLDVSLHFHTHQFDVNQWFLHECNTERAADGRTYSSGRIFQNDELIATMAQSCIIRRNKPSKL